MTGASLVAGLMFFLVSLSSIQGSKALPVKDPTCSLARPHKLIVLYVWLASYILGPQSPLLTTSHMTFLSDIWFTGSVLFLTLTSCDHDHDILSDAPILVVP